MILWIFYISWTVNIAKWEFKHGPEQTNNDTNTYKPQVRKLEWNQSSKMYESQLRKKNQMAKCRSFNEEQFGKPAIKEEKLQIIMDCKLNVSKQQVTVDKSSPFSLSFFIPKSNLNSLSSTCYHNVYIRKYVHSSLLSLLKEWGKVGINLIHLCHLHLRTVLKLYIGYNPVSRSVGLLMLGFSKSYSKTRGFDQ